MMVGSKTGKRKYIERGNKNENGKPGEKEQGQGGRRMQWAVKG